MVAEDADAGPPVVEDAEKGAPAEKEDAGEALMVEEVGAAALVENDPDDESPASVETGVKAPWEETMIVTEDPLCIEAMEEAVLAADETVVNMTAVVEESAGEEDIWLALIWDGWTTEEVRATEETWAVEDDATGEEATDD